MTLLRDSSSSIQYEAFHVFKIFVANPHKDERVLDVLLRNQACMPPAAASSRAPIARCHAPSRAAGAVCSRV